jgi:hypothetical protein
MVQTVKVTNNAYTMLSAGLALTGALLTVMAYFVLRSTPLSALGISTMIVAAVSFSLGRGQPKIPPEASAILLQSGVENVSAIVEELGLKAKAIYLPSSMTSGKPQALIPLHSNPHPPQLGRIILPKRLIVKHGPKSEDVGLLVTTAGSAVGSLVTAKTDASEGDLEATLGLILASTVNLADGARVTVNGDAIRVEVSKPRLEQGKMWIYESLGSPLASIVASIVAEVLDQPVSVQQEQYSRDKCVVELKLTGRSF